MILLDTGVMLYAVGAEHDLKAPAQDLIQRIGDGRVRATTTVAVIQEFVHVYARRRPRAETAKLASRFTELLAPLVVSTATALRGGLSLYERYDQIDAFDAVLAATVIEVGAEALVSADAGFASVPSLPYVPLLEADRLIA